MEKILITGGTGLIGTELSKILHRKGYEINLLTRKINKQIPYNQFLWDVNSRFIDTSSIDNVRYIVHLAGANISDKRWTKSHKEEILKSRVQSAQLILNACQEKNFWPDAFISTSAIGYYGSFNSDRILTETDNPGNDFLAQICEHWEKASDLFAEKGIRTVKIRTGVVLAKEQGAYAKISKTVKQGMAAAIGNGKQYMPWIHISDIANIFMKALEDKNMHGVYNGVAPEHITNKEFTAILAKSLHKSLLLPNIPAFTLKLIFGEMSDILLKGSRISSEKIIQQGYIFKFPTLEMALKDLAAG